MFMRRFWAVFPFTSMCFATSLRTGVHWRNSIWFRNNRITFVLFVVPSPAATCKSLLCLVDSIFLIVLLPMKSLSGYHSFMNIDIPSDDFERSACERLNDTYMLVIWVIIVWYNGLSPVRRQSIIGTKGDLLSVAPLNRLRWFNQNT